MLASRRDAAADGGSAGVGWDELALAVVVGWVEGVAAVGDEVVVVVADSSEVEEAGLAVVGDGVDVVVFEAELSVAAGDDALRVAVGDRGLELGGEVSAVVADGSDVFAFGDEDLEERAAEEVLASDGDWDGTDASDLAAFPLMGWPRRSAS